MSFDVKESSDQPVSPRLLSLVRTSHLPIDFWCQVMEAWRKCHPLYVASARVMRTCSQVNQVVAHHIERLTRIHLATGCFSFRLETCSCRANFSISQGRSQCRTDLEGNSCDVPVFSKLRRSRSLQDMLVGRRATTKQSHLRSHR